MKYKVLMIGRNRSFIPALEKAAPEMEVYMLEEPELIEYQKQNPLHSTILKEVRTGAYQQSTDLLETAQKWHEEIEFDVVVPGGEYAVHGAGLVADKLGLKYLGKKAIYSLTNKIRLRELCDKAGIGQPRFTQIESPADIRKFIKGEKIVIKPANRQASTGVLKVEQASDIEQAYAKMVGASEGQMVVDRPMHWEYIAEDYIPGFEVSVETIVKNGRAIFHNITGKKTTESSYCVELGHVVPAKLGDAEVKELYANQEKLVAALEAQDGFLHAEWKITNERPKLIECAGRVAGDYILSLIELAYGFNVYEAIIKTLAGEIVSLPHQAIRGACIRYFEPDPGILKEIYSTEALTQSNPHLIDWSITVKPGDRIHPIESSWSRIGYVIVTGKDNEEAYRQAETLFGQVKFLVEK
jgi:biotin carboxylase